MRGLARLAVIVAAVAACGKGAASAAPAAARDAATGDARFDGAVADDDPRAAELWTRAADGEADDLERLAAYVGSDGLVAASPVPARRVVALRALAFADDFTALPFLAKVATAPPDGDATAALDAVVALAAEPRRATDPEDALEVREGCSLLLLLARDPLKAPARRARAISALRLLADRGWVAPGEVPADLDPPR